MAYAKSDRGMWTVLLLPATVRSFAHVSLGISDRNSANRAVGNIALLHNTPLGDARAGLTIGQTWQMPRAPRF